MRPGGEDRLRSAGAAVVNVPDDHAEGLKMSQLIVDKSRCCCGRVDVSKHSELLFFGGFFYSQLSRNAANTLKP